MLNITRVRPGEDGELSQIAITANSLALGSASIVSTTFEVELAHDGTAPTPAPEIGTPLTASFADLPQSHGGSEITFTLTFSEEFGLSWKTLWGYEEIPSAFEVANGTLTGTSRVRQDANRAWNITVTPNGTDDVTITLAATTDCAAAGAICTDDGRALSTAVVTTVPHTAQPVQPPPPVAFEVRFEDIVDEHDGTNAIVFKVMFNKRPKSSYSYETMRDSTIKVQQGDQTFGASYVRRLNRPHNDEWEATVTPVSKADLTVSVGPEASCSATC